MPIPLPNLDDRRWAELVDEGRALIPAYAPEWTDHNVHDPGLTVMELLAWLTEQDIYRLNRITDAQRRQLLGLIGVLQQPPQPAQSFVVIQPRKQESRELLSLPQHTELQAGAGDDALTFRTCGELQVLPTTVASLISKTSQGTRDWTEALERGDLCTPFGENPSPGSALQFGFDTPFTNEELTVSDKTVRLSVYFVSAAACQSVRIRPVSDSEAANHHSVRLAWDVRVKGAQNADYWDEIPLDNVVDETRAMMESGRVQINLPARSLRKTNVRRSLGRIHLRCRVLSGRYDAAPRLRGIYCNGVAVEQTASAGPSTWMLPSSESATAYQIGWPEPAAKTLISSAASVLPVAKVGPAELRTHELEWAFGSASKSPVMNCELVDEAGSPVVDAVVTLREANSERQSDADGRVRFYLPLASGDTPWKLVYTLEIRFLGGRVVVPIRGVHPEGAQRALQVRVRILSMNLLLPAAETGTNESADAKVRFEVLNYEPVPGEDKVAVTLDADEAATGDGTPHQTHRLSGAPVASKTPSLFGLDQDSLGWEKWTRRRNLRASSRGQRHFLLDHQTGKISFGDGEQAQVLPAQKLLGTWTLTRGDAGNIPRDQIDRFSEKGPNRFRVPKYESLRQHWKVSQPYPASGGRAAETLAEAASRALRIMNRTERAITLDDYERLARETPHVCVARSKAWAHVHPAFPCMQAPGMLTLVVVPYLPVDRPQPSPELLQCIARHLHARRLMGTRVEVVGPTYVTVRVQAHVRAHPGSDPARMADQIAAAINAFWHPLTGGPDGKGWPFGRDVYRSEVLQVIDEVPGVDHALELRFVDEDGQVLCGNVCVPDQGLVAAGNHEITVLRAEQ